MSDIANGFKEMCDAVIEFAAEVSAAEHEKTEKECAEIAPEKQEKLDKMRQRLAGMEKPESTALEHLINAYEITYTTPKYVAAHSWRDFICTEGPKPSHMDYLLEKDEYDRGMAAAKIRVQSNLSKAYENAKAYFSDEGDYSCVLKAGKNFRDQIELREQQLLHELSFIGNNGGVTEDINRIKDLLETDKMAGELEVAFKRIVRTKIVADFPSYSTICDLVKYEKTGSNENMSLFDKLIEGELFDTVEVDADKAWDKLYDALINGLDTFMNAAESEILSLLRRKCGMPIELILEEIEEKLQAA